MRPGGMAVGLSSLFWYMMYYVSRFFKLVFFWWGLFYYTFFFGVCVWFYYCISIHYIVFGCAISFCCMWFFFWMETPLGLSQK
jgi:hypothetical protein